jgi:hypothetical protein
VEHLAEALRFKPEGGGLKFFIDSASNRNEYQEYFQGGKGERSIGLTTLPLSYADCLEIWKPQPPGTLRSVQAYTGTALPLTWSRAKGLYFLNKCSETQRDV